MNFFLFLLDLFSRHTYLPTMRTNNEHLSPAKALVMQWRALWTMAYVFAKTMTLAQYRDPRRAAEKAEMLELWSRFAVFTLIGQIAALESSGVSRSKDDDLALSHLRGLVGALAMLCALAAKVKRECLGRAGSAEQCDHRYAPPNISARSCVNPSLQFNYFDTS